MATVVMLTLALALAANSARAASCSGAVSIDGTKVKSGTIDARNYAKTSKTGTTCSWKVVAPKGSMVRVVFSDAFGVRNYLCSCWAKGGCATKTCASKQSALSKTGVDVLDGAKSMARLCCDTGRAKAYTTTSNELTVKLTSLKGYYEGSTPGAGFTAAWSVVSTGWKDCAGSYVKGTCDAAKGTRVDTFKVTTAAVNGGKACPASKVTTGCGCSTAATLHSDCAKFKTLVGTSWVSGGPANCLRSTTCSNTRMVIASGVRAEMVDVVMKDKQCVSSQYVCGRSGYDNSGTGARAAADAAALAAARADAFSRFRCVPLHQRRRLLPRQQRQVREREVTARRLRLQHGRRWLCVRRLHLQKVRGSG